MKFQPVWSVAIKNLRSFESFTLTCEAVRDIMGSTPFCETEVREAFIGNRGELLCGEFREVGDCNHWEIKFWKSPERGIKGSAEVGSGKERLGLQEPNGNKASLASE